MRTRNPTSITIQAVTSITCNRCGFTVDLSKEDYELFLTDMLHEFSISFGYGSGHDLENWKFDLCEDCIEEIVKTFKIPVKKSMYDIWNGKEIGEINDD